MLGEIWDKNELCKALEEATGPQGMAGEEVGDHRVRLAGPVF